MQYTRNALVEHVIKQVVSDNGIISAFKKVPRRLFVPPKLRAEAYENYPLLIGYGQTTSQPSLIAQMLEALRLRGNETVLEIGTGSGYQTALLSFLCKQVYSIERIPQLAKEAQKRLRSLGYMNVEIMLGDGTLGLPEKGPFHAVIVSAGSPGIPPPLIEQLFQGGRIVIPVGEERGHQVIHVGTKVGNHIQVERREPVQFVPLIGKHGWPIEYST